MTREEKIARARVLRAEGLPLRQIAAELGIDPSTARRWVNAEAQEADRASARAWKAAHRDHVRAYDKAYNRQRAGTCQECGGSMGAGVRNDGRCRTCWDAAVAARRRDMEALWAAGWKIGQIAERYGWSVDHVTVEMHYARAEGYSLPHRRTPEQRARMSAARKQAA